MRGRIHSVETCGTVDGPGIRFVIFTQGCPLRCLYCHNPDCRSVVGGHEVTVEDLIAEIKTYRSYLRRGGVTISGGEPLMQPEFVQEICQRCHDLGIHTAVDTSGYIDLELSRPVLDLADLVLLDIKSYRPQTYHQITHVSLEPTLETARYLDQIHKPMWIRFVLVPGLSDDGENIQGLAQFVAQLTNVERVEVLPFHKMGEYKWEQLGLDYQLKDTAPPDPELIRKTVQTFEHQGLPVTCAGL